MPEVSIVAKSINEFIEDIDKGKWFSLAGYSDAEWYCILGIREGSTTGAGQTLSVKHGEKLGSILHRRCNESENFHICIPDCLWELPMFENGEIDQWVRYYVGHSIDVYERDCLTDTLAEQAELHSFIECLKDKNTVLIGNHNLHNMESILNLNQFVGTSSPNLHMEEKGIEKVCGRIENARNYEMEENGIDLRKNTVYLVSAGVSAACIIDNQYELYPHNWYIDCGSIWDAFCGIGCQREWRRQLYMNPDKLRRWRHKNLHGADIV